MPVNIDDKGAQKVTHLSPSSIGTFYKAQNEYYLTYLSGNRPDRVPQTRPMSVGSSFDAFAKAFLHERLFGKGTDPRFEFQAIFETQVEAHQRDYALSAGKICWDEYYQSGALADLLLELQNSIVTPRFEFEISGVINGRREGFTRDIGGVPLKGKPDVFFVNKAAAHVILDWKVNGYDSATGASPMQGYVRLREGGWNSGPHKSAVVQPYKGMMINVGDTLDSFNNDWARQLGIYAWLVGEDIGGDFLVAIDQIVCRPKGRRFAEHRLKISSEGQWRNFASAQYVWEVINSDHFFREMTLEDSITRCKTLDNMAVMLKDKTRDDPDKWFAEMMRV